MACPILQNPIPRVKFKRMIKQAILEYWQKQLRAEVSTIDFLNFIHPNFMSLKFTHPIWSTAGTNPYEINKAIIQAGMLSGQYRTEGLCRFWSSNCSGSCLLQSCSAVGVKEDIVHILIHCPSLSSTRSKLNEVSKAHAATNPHIPCIRDFLETADPMQKTQFLLDC